MDHKSFNTPVGCRQHCIAAMQNRLDFPRGFTLIELMVAIALLAILVSMGMPSYTQFVANQRLTSQANDLVGDILLARSEAATRGTPTIICSSANGTTCSGLPAQWNVGRIIFVDANRNDALDAGEPILRVTQVSGNPTITSTGFPNADWLGFLSYGGLKPAASSGGSFKFCLSASNTGRQVAVNAMGRPSVTPGSCP